MWRYTAHIPLQMIFNDLINLNISAGSAPGARIEVVPHQPEVVFVNPARGRINAVAPTNLPVISASATSLSAATGPASSPSIQPQFSTEEFSPSTTGGFKTNPTVETLGRQSPSTEASTKLTSLTNPTVPRTTTEFIDVNRTQNCSQRCGTNAHCIIGADGNPTCVCDKGFSGDGLYCVGNC